MPFTHLHVHSHYSLLDGACKIKDLIKQAKNLGMNKLALTDHGNMFGALEFYSEAMAGGIKPIIGFEAYIAPKSRFEKQSGQNRRDTSFHLTLLARNKKGYHNLLQLCSAGYLEGFYYKPRIDREILSEHSEGLIGLSGCAGSEISRLLLEERTDKAAELSETYAEIFGKDNFYLEVQDNGLKDQAVIKRLTRDLAKRTGLKTVATNDTHYLRKEDAIIHDILLCLQTGKKLDDEKRMRFETEEFYLKSPAEMKALFSDMPEAIESTGEIADKCNINFNFGQYHIPRFDIPDNKTPADYLREITEAGLRERYETVTPDLQKRLDYELSVINDMQFPGYFLIVWDFIRHAKENKIPVGPGRGSAAGSLVAYSLGITDLDPIKYDLIFERFLNPSRISMPDIDIDFCKERRGDIIEYVRKKYGRSNVAQIITFGTMAARGSIRDVARVFDIPLDRVDKIAKLVPGGPGVTIKKALESVPEFRQEFEEDDLIQTVINSAMKIEGLARHASTHAAGVVIADRPITEYVPLYKSGEDISTQYTMETLEAKCGLLKMDFLGLQTLTIIKNALYFIKQSTGKDLDINTIPMDDKGTYEMLAHGESIGIFQTESSGFRDLLQKLQPDCFEDIIALVAMYRPGPLGSGMVDSYIEVKHGKKKAQFLHEKLKPILNETHGVILYQEQVMRIANNIAGMSMAEADHLRKAMGKKKEEILLQAREDFIDGAKKNDIPQDVAENLYSQILHFGGYGFNKSHSAAYGLITYRTAYLKKNYPLEFMAALLTAEMENTDKLIEYIEECRRMEIELLPPCVNRSKVGFSLEDGKIRMGLNCIKKVGKKAVESIIDTRESKGEFQSIYDFCARVDLRLNNKQVIEALNNAGGFTATSARRSQIAAILERAINLGVSTQKDRKRGQLSLFEMDGSTQQNTPEEYPDIPEWPEEKLLSNEKEALGFYITKNPLTSHLDTIRKFSTVRLEKAQSLPDSQTVTVGGIIVGARSFVPQSKQDTGEKMAMFHLDDLTDKVKVLLFTQYYKKYGELAETDKIVFVKGQVISDKDDFFIKAEEIIPIDQAQEYFTSMVFIKLIATGLEEETLVGLREILLRYQGQCPVFVEMQAANHTRIVMKSKKYSVLPSRPFRKDIEQLIGKGHLVLYANGFEK